MIVRRRSVGERPEAAQQRELLLAETRNVSEGLRSRQHREQAQEQDLLERINDLAGLSMVRHILEKREKNRRLDQRRANRFRHQSILHSESEDAYRFSSNPFCHLSAQKKIGAGGDDSEDLGEWDAGRT